MNERGQVYSRPGLQILSIPHAFQRRIYCIHRSTYGLLVHSLRNLEMLMLRLPSGPRSVWRLSHALSFSYAFRNFDHSFHVCQTQVKALPKIRPHATEPATTTSRLTALTSSGSLLWGNGCAGIGSFRISHRGPPAVTDPVDEEALRRHDPAEKRLVRLEHFRALEAFHAQTRDACLLDEWAPPCVRNR